MKNRKELIGNFLFFPKNEGKKITQKLNDILKNQKEIKDDITEIKQILKEELHLKNHNHINNNNNHLKRKRKLLENNKLQN